MIAFVVLTCKLLVNGVYTALSRFPRLIKNCGKINLYFLSLNVPVDFFFLYTVYKIHCPVTKISFNFVNIIKSEIYLISIDPEFVLNKFKSCSKAFPKRGVSSNSHFNSLSDVHGHDSTRDRPFANYYQNGNYYDRRVF